MPHRVLSPVHCPLRPLGEITEDRLPPIGSFDSETGAHCGYPGFTTLELGGLSCSQSPLKHSHTYSRATRIFSRCNSSLTTDVYTGPSRSVNSLRVPPKKGLSTPYTPSQLFVQLPILITKSLVNLTPYLTPACSHHLPLIHVSEIPISRPQWHRHESTPVALRLGSDFRQNQLVIVASWET